jgi:hypothetical protein
MTDSRITAMIDMLDTIKRAMDQQIDYCTQCSLEVSLKEYDPEYPCYTGCSCDRFEEDTSRIKTDIFIQKSR